MAFSKSVQRLKTPREAWLGIIRTLYMLFGFPFLLFIGLVLVIPDTSRVPGETLGASIIWTGILLSIGIFFSGVFSRRRLLNDTTDALRDPAYFSPGEGYEFFQQKAGKYLGIDTRNGTILYVHRIRKGQVDVVALTMDDWTNCEVEGTNIFRLYTKYSDVPRLEIKTPWAERWYDTIGAMKHKQYSTPRPFSMYVAEHIEKLERDNNIHIPKVS
ncbi:putative exclusion-determining protein [Pseudomonas syringae pv. theae ICMP 3923]|uniref:plasmid IncI1-type surface exclusion protein ExcA n=1 Tax=Pseudomonas syringae TaxID=317 RepID=UPI0003576F50|nr:plasmid IncI1-type surface exclusion protein ExcA [Pseudomonas syringae]EPM65638.1 putative exclusion-determining protein [Pseudomonas syringae pv. theae ICMP 3923]